jgi:PIN domain
VFRILVDTCVWFDLAKDDRQHRMLDGIEQLIGGGSLALIVPQIAVEELRLNRQRIAKESQRSLASNFRTVKEAVGRVGGDKKRMLDVLAHLDNASHKIPLIGGAAVNALDRIERLLTASPPIVASEAVMSRAARRALDRRAPFHHGKNEMADAIMMETYSECLRDKSAAGVRFAFVTHNKADFSVHGGNENVPHADFADSFSRVKSRYYINLADALRRVDPAVVTDALYYEWRRQPRGLTEIVEAEDLLFNQVWYNRHWNMRGRIERGETFVTDDDTQDPETWSHGTPATISKRVLGEAARAMEKLERHYGKEKLGPWDDFEWGMINGKLSALRWVLGDEWDMLDT